jgi:cytochrome c-type biogenesis protein
MDLAPLMQAIEQASWATPLAAFLWGLASIGLSPCHLSGVPLLVTFLGRLDGQTLSASRLSALITAGISVSLIVVAAITYALGHLLGDLWGVGPWLMIALLLLGGLNLMGALEIPSFGRLDPDQISVGPKSALASGAILGTTLGPCTFSFFAPVLALMGSNSDPLLIGASVAAFVVGHLGFTWVLGAVGATVGAQLSQGARWAKVIKFAVGALAIALALNLIITTP